MRSLLVTLGLMLALSTAYGQKGAWTGSLADADCKQLSPKQACPVSRTTKSFGLLSSEGRFLPFDVPGNSEAKKALGVSGKIGNPTAKVEGEIQDGSIKVKSVTLL